MSLGNDNRYRLPQDPDQPLRLLYGDKGPHVSSVFEVHEMIERGLPSDVVIAFAESMELDRQAFIKLIGMSERTLQRRLKHPEPLSAEQSSSAWRLAKVLSRAEEVLGSRRAAVDWLMAPALGLEGHAPVDLLTTQVGFELVDDFLTRLDYGVY
ncbi:DUF2384 domain-containing protein [Pseudomonas citronellolis]|uniref:type II RES/Xre toxin-antitoxin system antitoxin n=1 Tax=Pseudomonas citronellolis TaxID=53408 RepID=UPI002111A4D6|nr:antitoxin Xre-like helix-turn-helix domain-containing protein [Pseudomonas citronellolis]UUC48060.1 DUF2384 domain-containing protein [Pseudomonas citronellolis]